MADERLQYKFEQYAKALGRLRDAAHEENDPSNFIADASIQRFEFVLELAWKFLKYYLEDQGVGNIATPVDALKEAYAAGLIESGDTWIEMVKQRNVTSHTYDDKTAAAIYNTIRAKYVPLFDNLERVMCERV